MPNGQREEGLLASSIEDSPVCSRGGIIVDGKLEGILYPLQKLVSKLTHVLLGTSQTVFLCKGLLQRLGDTRNIPFLCPLPPYPFTCMAREGSMYILVDLIKSAKIF